MKYILIPLWKIFATGIAGIILLVAHILAITIHLLWEFTLPSIEEIKKANICYDKDFMGDPRMWATMQYPSIIHKIWGMGEPYDGSKDISQW